MLYTLVVMFYDLLTTEKTCRVIIAWHGKRTIAFSDMLSEVRRHLWWKSVFAQVPGGQAWQKLPRSTQTLLNFGLLQAA